MMGKSVEEYPVLHEEIQVTSKQSMDYQENGHTCLRGIASSDEIQQYGEVIRDYVKNHNYHNKSIDNRDTYGKAFIQLGNVWEQNEVVRRFVMAHRFAKVAAELMGVDGVRIYHDQALFKEPGGGHTPWHQDQIYWPLDTHNTITMWMPIVPISEEMGSMTFASGSQKMGYINKLKISDESHRTLKSYIEEKGFDQVTYGAMDAGDATFHAGWALHSAPGNPTEQMREVMTIIYFADGTRALEPDSNARKNDMNRFMPSIQAGDIVNSPLNPLVYKKL